MRLLLFIIFVSFSVSPVFAANIYFANDTASSDPNNWFTVTNWLDDFLQPMGRVPASTDRVVFNVDNFQCYLNVPTTVRYLECPYGTETGHFTVQRNGDLTVVKTWNVGTVDGNDSVVDIDDGGKVTVQGVNLSAPVMIIGNIGRGLINVRGILDFSNKDVTCSYGQADAENVVKAAGTINVLGNGQVKNIKTIYQGNLPGPHTGTLNIIDPNSSLTCNTLYMGNGGRGVTTVHNGHLTCTNVYAPYGTPDPYTGEQFAKGDLTISGSGHVTMGDMYILCVTEGSGAGSLTINDNGVLDANSIVAGQGGPATINMNGGTLNCNSLYLTWASAPSVASCQINLFGGTVNVKETYWVGYNSKRYFADYGHDDVHIDLRNNGKLVVPYAHLAEIIGDVDLGIIKAYGGAGTVIVTSDETAGTCTVQGCIAGVVAGDITGDCVVDLSDLTQLSLNWLSSSGGIADLNSDGSVNLKDFAELASNWFYGKN